MIHHQPHDLFVASICLVGLLLVSLGAARLKAGRFNPDSPYAESTITMVYSTMILLGAAFLVFAVHWRFFQA